MALEIWAGEQADRLDLENLIADHKMRGLGLCVIEDGKPLSLAVDGGTIRGLVTELLRLALIGQLLVENASSLEHVRWLAGRARGRDEVLIATLGGEPSPAAPIEDEA